MVVNMLIANGSLSESEISKFEAKLGFGLPSEYRNFLIKTNGGQCADATVSTSKPGNFLVDYIFGLGLNRQLDLSFWQDEFNGDIPEKSIIIGSDAGGGFLLLLLADGRDLVYYYDHAHSFASSSEQENTYLICDKFSDFLDLIL